MTSRPDPSTIAGQSNAITVDADVDLAVEAAARAAHASGVVVRELDDLSELMDLVSLFATIWGRDANPPVTVELLRAFTKAGNYVCGAFDGDRLVGGCVGFFHAPADDALHSHIAGVAPQMAGRSVGFALKLHQRAWAMTRGVAEIAWTFDPLGSRNAYFNLSKLRARPVEYLPNFYGAMLDTINGEDDSDRLLVKWRLRDPEVCEAALGHRSGESSAELDQGAVVGLAVDADGAPAVGELSGPTVFVAVPRDIAALRSEDPALAARWRRNVREVLLGLVAAGGRIDGFDRAGRYIVRRNG